MCTTMHIPLLYVPGPNIRRYVSTVWNNQNFILRRAGFYSEAIDVKRGCTQGDTNSPIIFNLIIDSVLRSWKKDGAYGGSRACFYADDGLIEHGRWKNLQSDLDRMVRLFARVGLKANEGKTKWMLFRGAPAPKAMKKEVYDKMWKKRRRKKRREGDGKYEEWRRKRVECERWWRWIWRRLRQK